MITVLLLLWSAVSTDRIKVTKVDYRMVQQLDGLKKLVNLDGEVTATCNLVLVERPANYR